MKIEARFDSFNSDDSIESDRENAYRQKGNMLKSA